MLVIASRKAFIVWRANSAISILTLGAVLADKTIAFAPFNPVTLNVTLWVLSIIGLILSKDMPSAKSCKRKRGGTA